MTPVQTSAHPRRALRLAVEFLLLFFGVPLLCLYVLRSRYIIPVLWVATAACLVALLRDRGFPRRELWNGSGFTRQMRRVVGLFLVAAILLSAAVLWLTPEQFLRFPKERTRLWAMVMVLYPLLSVYPQELIYRTFMFRRYRVLLPHRWAMVTASAVSFGFAHLVFWNPIAVVLSTLGGVLFALTYWRTRSLLITCAEHALYGCLIFTVGLGPYFFHGSVRLVQQASGG
jgi:uncharacterized protein